MIQVLRIGHTCFALPRSANVAAIIKALQGAVEVRSCYSNDKYEYREVHKKDSRVEVVLVADGKVGRANPDKDDYDQPLDKPVKRPSQIGAPELLLAERTA